MTVSRIMPTALLVAVAAVIVTPIAISFHMMAAHPQKSSGSKKSTAKDQPATLAGFDGDRAYKYLVEQCDIGPRISGTDGNRKLRDRMVEHFTGRAADVRRQTFEVRHPLTGDPVELENIIASWHAERKSRVLLAAHFDTRPRADKESNAARRSQPILGANDGASGVAVLMELAHLMPEIETKVGVDFVAFDAEELVYDENDEYFLGSQHFAREYEQRAGDTRYVAAILVDMIGDKQLNIYPDDEGRRQAPELVDQIWSIARRLRATGFKTGRVYEVRDDHLPLLAAGIPAIDIIDFDYGPDHRYWHTLQDTPDKCSARSLAQVGGVLAEWLRGQ